MNMHRFDELLVRASSMGWRVVMKEFYNPGGTTYRDVLVDAEGKERGFVDKYVKTKHLGKIVSILILDPDAPAWESLKAETILTNF
jgi:hypothetical protein